MAAALLLDAGRVPVGPVPATAQALPDTVRAYQYRSLDPLDPSMITLTYDGGSDSTLLDTVRVQTVSWSGGVDDGLVQFFREEKIVPGDPADLRADLFFHGFDRPGFTGHYDPPMLFLPAQLDVSTQWSYQGIFTFTSVSDSGSSSLNLTFAVTSLDTITVPYGTFVSWRVSETTPAPAAGAAQALLKAHGLDLWGRRAAGVLAAGDATAKGPFDRWFRRRQPFRLLLKDGSVELVDGDFTWAGAVPVERRGWGALKRAYRWPTRP